MRDRAPRARVRELGVARVSRTGRACGAPGERRRTSISVHVDFFQELVLHAKVAPHLHDARDSQRALLPLLGDLLCTSL